MALPPPVTETVTNIAINPSFENPGVTVPIATNLAINPFCLSPGGDMGRVNNAEVNDVDRGAVVSQLGSSATRFVRKASSLYPTAVCTAHTLAGIPGTNADPYQLQIDAVCSVRARVILGSGNAPVEVQPLVKTRLTVTVPANTVLYLTVHAFDGTANINAPVGSWFAYTNATTDPQGRVFSGSTTLVSGFDTSWTGQENNSPSKLFYTRAQGYPYGQRTSQMASDGSYSLLLNEQNGNFQPVHRNLYPNPSFETNVIPDDSIISTDWAILGTRSLLVTGGSAYPSTTRYPSHNLYPRKKDL